MKAKHALLLFAAGMCADFIGALFKILHWAHADWLLLMGMVLKVTGIVLFLLKLLRHPRAKAFLNR